MPASATICSGVLTRWEITVSTDPRILAVSDLSAHALHDLRREDQRRVEAPCLLDPGGHRGRLRERAELVDDQHTELVSGLAAGDVVHEILEQEPARGHRPLRATSGSPAGRSRRSCPPTPIPRRAGRGPGRRTPRSATAPGRPAPPTTPQQHSTPGAPRRAARDPSARAPPPRILAGRAGDRTPASAPSSRHRDTTTRHPRRRSR